MNILENKTTENNEKKTITWFDLKIFFKNEQIYKLNKKIPYLSILANLSLATG